MTPQQLFDHLLTQHENATYSSAYAALFGKTAKKWSQAYANQVVSLAAAAGQRTFNGRAIGLDTLIVAKESGEPSAGHFRGRPYDIMWWRQMFGSWPICRHP